MLTVEVTFWPEISWVTVVVVPGWRSWMMITWTEDEDEELDEEEDEEDDEDPPWLDSEPAEPDEDELELELELLEPVFGGGGAAT